METTKRLQGEATHPEFTLDLGTFVRVRRHQHNDIRGWGPILSCTFDKRKLFCFVVC